MDTRGPGAVRGVELTQDGEEGARRMADRSPVWPVVDMHCDLLCYLAEVEGAAYRNALDFLGRIWAD